ncbi:MAG: hypothetical protein WC394_05510, partial [Candidatus Omnitrophota bacterium]
MFIINQNGVLFGPNAQVNVGGLIASSLDIKDSDFLAGRYTFFGKGGSVVNQGYISAPGGYVALLGSTVDNAGIIEADLGSVALASGELITLNLDPEGIISVVIDEETSENLEGKDDAVKNTGKITAKGGKVILTAKTLDGIFKRAVNNEGIIEAKSLVGRKGEVVLSAAGEESVVSNTGTIDVSATEAGAGGGSIELSGGNLDLEKGVLKATAEDGEVGRILLDPWNWVVGDIQEFLFNSWGDVDIELTAGNNVDFILGNFGGDDTLNLNNLINGSFTVKAGRDINLNNDSIVTQGGGINLLADMPVIGWWGNPQDGIGNVNLGSGAGLNSNGGNINLSGVDINLSALVNAGSGDVMINAQNAILDGNDADPNIIADNLSLSAVNGIGSGDALETQVNSLEASNTNNNIEIDNTGDLRIANSGITNGSGDVNIGVHSDLVVDAAINTNYGDVNLSADGSITHTANGDVFTKRGNFTGNAAINGGNGGYTFE